jgi:hypothetical protein
MVMVLTSGVPHLVSLMGNIAFFTYQNSMISHPTLCPGAFQASSTGCNVI